MVLSWLHLYHVPKFFPFKSFRGYYRCLTVSSLKQCQNNVSKTTSSSKGSSNTEGNDETPHKLWMLRFTHENSFLSWSRNAVICAGVGATLKMVDGNTPLSLTLSTGFFDLGVMFMTIGSAHHVFSSMGLRHLIGISGQGLLWIITYTTGIWLLYLLILFKIRFS